MMHRSEQLGSYTVCQRRRTDRMPVVERRNCADYTTLAERIADKEAEQARLRALNREMRRQWRRDHPLRLGDRLLLIASAASCITLLLIAAGAL